MLLQIGPICKVSKEASLTKLPRDMDRRLVRGGTILWKKAKLNFTERTQKRLSETTSSSLPTESKIVGSNLARVRELGTSNFYLYLNSHCR
jgi:hypothetical protein